MTLFRDQMQAIADDMPAAPDFDRTDFDDSLFGLPAGIAVTHEQVMATYSAGTSDEDMIRQEEERNDRRRHEERDGSGGG